MKNRHYLTVFLLLLGFVQAKAQCAASGSHYTASYPTGWTLTDLGDGTNALSNNPSWCNDLRNGTIYTAGNAAYFYTARSGRELRVSKDIPMVSNTSWTMDFTLIISPSYYPSNLMATNSPSVVLASLTSAPMSLVSSCGTPAGTDFCISCGSYPNTNMDAIWVSLESDNSGNCHAAQTGKNWRIVASARDGNGAQTNSTPISITSGAPGTYYVRLQRTSASQAMVSVFTNSNFSSHLSGSPQCLSVSGIVENLDVLSHEVNAQGSCHRVFNGIVDHLKIDNSVTCPTQLTASVSAATTVCEGDPIYVNGSSNGTPYNASWHIWFVQESDASGNQFGPTWWGQWTAGVPGNISLPFGAIAAAGINMTCGKYYKVSLAVQNCGNPWAYDSKVIYIACNPTVQLNGSASVVCAGDPGGITANVSGGSGSYTMIIEHPTNGIIYSGPPSSILVFPTGTTTYQVIVFDDVTGCYTIVPWTITVVSCLQTNDNATAAPFPESRTNIFPNPSDGLFTIDLGDETIGALIEVTDARGQKVKTLEQQASQTELDLSGFSKGLYTVTITTNGRTEVKKIALQ